MRNHPGVSNLNFDRHEPATTSAIHAWETAHAPLKLPEDLKAFLLLSDGFALRWDVYFGGRTHALGNMALNGIRSLGNKISLDASPVDDPSDGIVVVPPGSGSGGGWGAFRSESTVGGAHGLMSKTGVGSTLANNPGGGGGGVKGNRALKGITRGGVIGRITTTGVDSAINGGGDGGGGGLAGWQPPVPTAAFDLDSSCACGRVALVFVSTSQTDTSGAAAAATDNPSSSPHQQQQRQGQQQQQQGAQVWFQDLSTRWHVLAGSFSEYFRVMAAHLGLPNWQYAFTDVGLDPAARQWFAFLGPERLAVDLERGRLRRAKKVRRGAGAGARAGAGRGGGGKKSSSRPGSSAGAIKLSSPMRPPDVGVGGGGAGNSGGTATSTATAAATGAGASVARTSKLASASGAWSSPRGGGGGGGGPSGRPPSSGLSSSAARARSLYASSFGPASRGGGGGGGGGGGTGSSSARPSSAPSSRKPMR